MRTNTYYNKKKKPIVSNILKASFIAIILFLTYIPLISIALTSLNSSRGNKKFTGFTMKWYVELFKDQELMNIILKNTVLVSIIATVIATILGTITAIGINSLSKKRRRQMIMLNNVPILNADIATAILLFIIFHAVGTIFGLKNHLNYATLVIAHIFFATPYVVLSVLPKLGEIDKNLYDAALDLGCKPRRAIFKVIIPAIKSGIFTGAMLAFTMSIDDFVISYFVSGDMAQNFSTWFYSAKDASQSQTVQLAAAYNTLLTVITITALIVYNIIKRKKEKKIQ